MYDLPWYLFSLLEHKEFRFLMPILPLVMHISASYIHQITDTTTDTPPDRDTEDLQPAEVLTQLAQRKKADTQSSWFKRILVLLLIVMNLPLALYTCLIHQRGTVDVMKFLADESRYDLPAPGQMSVFYLMPCHSTPYYRYMYWCAPLEMKSSCF